MSDEPPANPLIPVSPDPEHVSPAGWVYPRTWEDRFAACSRPVVRGLLALIGAGVLVLGGLWAIPSLVVARRPSYALACERARHDGRLTSTVGQGVTSPTLPDSYRLDQDAGDVYEWWVQGPRGRARVRAEVKDGAVRQFRVLELQLGWFD